MIPAASTLDFSLGAVDLAQQLLGQVLVREEDGERSSGIIVETEAYPGGSDKASHSHGNRKTPRNASMFLPGGHLYVYLVYGMHHCVNIVSGKEGVGEAVLIRALEPVEGIQAMRARCPKRRQLDLCRGPGRLTEALGIDLRYDGYRLSATSTLRIEPGMPRSAVRKGPRIGVEYAGIWARRHYRFLMGPQRHWSKPLKSNSSKTSASPGR